MMVLASIISWMYYIFMTNGTDSIRNENINVHFTANYVDEETVRVTSNEVPMDQFMDTVEWEDRKTTMLANGWHQA